MKRLTFLTAIVAFACCVKPVGDMMKIVDLTITKTETPPLFTVSQGISSKVKSYGADLCFHFLQNDVKRLPSNIFEIRSKATYPSGATACPTALYVVDTTVNIPIAAPGQYILRFYNGTNLFKSDTVQVN